MDVGLSSSAAAQPRKLWAGLASPVWCLNLEAGRGWQAQRGRYPRPFWALVLAEPEELANLEETARAQGLHFEPSHGAVPSYPWNIAAFF